MSEQEKINMQGAETTLDQDILEALDKVEEETFIYKGTTYTMTSFMQAHHLTSSEAEKVLKVLRAKGLIINPQKVNRDKDIEKALHQGEVLYATEIIEEENTAQAQYAVQTRREQVLSYSSVDFDFSTRRKAQEFTLNVQNMFLQFDILVSGDIYIVRVYNIPQKELNALTRSYKSDQFITNASRKVNNITNKTVATVDYMSRNIVTPISKSAFDCTVKTASVLVSGAARIAACGLVAISKGIQQGAQAIQQDTEITAAHAELINAKNAVIDMYNSGQARGGNGIHINRD